MTATYAVSFEFETTPPLTLRGVVTASRMPTLVAQAARTTMRAAGRQTSTRCCTSCTTAMRAVFARVRAIMPCPKGMPKLAPFDYTKHRDAQHSPALLDSVKRFQALRFKRVEKIRNTCLAVSTKTKQLQPTFAGCRFTLKQQKA